MRTCRTAGQMPSSNCCDREEKEDRTGAMPERAHASSPFQCAPREAREAQAFPPTPSGSCGAGASPASLIPRHRIQGMPRGRGGRKLNSHYRCADRGKCAGNVTSFANTCKHQPRMDADHRGSAMFDPRASALIRGFRPESQTGHGFHGSAVTVAIRGLLIAYVALASCGQEKA